MENRNYKILVPYGFTNESKSGLESAIKLAEQYGYEIALLHVIDENKPEGFDPSGDVLIKKRQSQEHQRFIKELAGKRSHMLREVAENQDTGVPITGELRFGSFIESIEGYLDSHDIQLIVMGSSGETAFDEFYKGSHTTRVRKVAKVPVIVVKEDLPVKEFQNIMILIDFREYDNSKLVAVKKLLHQFNLKLFLGHVKDSGSVESGDLKYQLRKKGKELGFEEFETVLIEGEGNKAEKIEKAMKERQIYLLSIISEVNSNFVRLFTENEARDIIEDIDEPVVSITE